MKHLLKLKRFFIMIFIFNNLAFLSTFGQENSGELVKRENIDPKYTWNLQDIYKTEVDWETDYKWIESQIPTYNNYKGKIGNSASDLYNFLKFDEKVDIILGKLFLYASLSHDLDLGDAKNQTLYNRVEDLWSRVSEATSFVTPEIMAIPEEKLWSYINSSDQLKIYTQYFNNLLRNKKHILSEKEERIIALASPSMQVPQNTFSLLKNVDLKYPSIKDEQGNDIQISDGRYYAAMYSTNRDFRKEAYKAYYVPYMENKNTLASLLVGNIKTNIFNAKARNYTNTLEAALSQNNIPTSVYDNLIKIANENIKVMHRWANLKKKVLNYNELHPYDTYVTLFPGTEKQFSFDEAKEVVLKSLQPLGKEYIKSLEFAFDNRWIDVYETKGKRSGAYSSDMGYGVHPYVLLNWNNQLNDVFTLIHEMGHNMHSHFSGTKQPFIYADYSIFVAEVASTANEALLLDYLIENATTKAEKLALIEKNLDNMTFTFFRQTGFAEYEREIHKLTESGESLTPDELTQLYGDLYQKYWGPSMFVDEEEKYTWSRIPHFYYNFYVYQYATSFAASQALVAKIKKEGQPAIDKYLAFLSSGSSDYPIEVLKKAGVDMNSKEPIEAVVNKMNKLLDEMERLLAE